MRVVESLVNYKGIASSGGQNEICLLVPRLCLDDKGFSMEHNYWHTLLTTISYIKQAPNIDIGLITNKVPQVLVIHHLQADMLRLYGKQA
jgi:hypothetical protein